MCVRPCRTDQGPGLTPPAYCGSERAGASRADGDWSLTTPVVLQEGSDVEHESTHVFDALNGMIGIEQAALAHDGTSIEVEYESSEFSEKASERGSPPPATLRRGKTNGPEAPAGHRESGVRLKQV